MPELLNQADLRDAQSLPFCYLCGLDFQKGSERNRDHVPPQAIFSKSDRNPPLILPTCATCNESQSGYDEQISQLVAVSYGKVPRQKDLRLKFIGVTDEESGAPFVGVRDIPIPEIVWRWVRGFHSALYRGFLPDETWKHVHLPFPGAVQQGSKFVESPILPQHAGMADVIKKNRAAKNLDRIKCFNDECTYECVWVESDDGKPFCMFAVRIYAWEKLADRRHFEKRGCVGFYIPERRGRPANATRSIDLEFDLPSESPLDPFG